ncbi:MAG: hypothetical protein HQM08_24485 [Candidatus Riflebacteria bacterium]|nr:hypothetical protein [Candidatus Riflebacteria bacterium]
MNEIRKALNSYGPKVIVISGGILFFFILVSSIYSLRFSPDAKIARQFLREMPVEKIQEVVLEPYPVSSLIENNIQIKDRKRISEIAEAFRTLQPFSAEHPFANWVCFIRFKLADKDFGGQVELTNNGQGVIFWYSSDVVGGWNYGCFRQDTIGPILEKIAREEKTKTFPLGNLSDKKNRK